MKKTIPIFITTGLLTLAIIDKTHAQTSKYARYTTNPSQEKNVSSGEFYNSTKILHIEIHGTIAALLCSFHCRHCTKYSRTC